MHQHIFPLQSNYNQYANLSLIFFQNSCWWHNQRYQSTSANPSCKECVKAGVACRGKVGYEAKCDRCSYGRKVCIVPGIRVKGDPDRYGRFGDMARMRAKREQRWVGDV